MGNLTRWTTHFISFSRLYSLQDPLQLAVLQSHTAIVAAQVGAAKSTEKIRLTEEATMQCLRIKDTQFWDGLQQVLGDIEPICYGTNIAQSNSTCPDQVLIMLAGLYLHFSNHPEPHVALSMMKWIES